MNENLKLALDRNWILSKRPEKNRVDPLRPYAWMVEKELTLGGDVEETGILFLSNKECSFTCLMCDLWKNTLDRGVPVGAIPEQIEWALKEMPSVQHLKLYNSGSFFDERAIPVSDHHKIAALLDCCQTVIVESHPNLIGEKCLEFRDLLSGELEVAMGLETAHPEVLEKLNKQMTLDDFREAAEFLNAHKIRFRTFILLRPPFLSEEEGVLWAKRSIDFAFDCGADCCTVIPVRAGNGAMEELSIQGHFEPPRIASLEEVMAYGINLGRGRVFADLWDLELFSDCPDCYPGRLDRLNRMNLTQECMPGATCQSCGLGIGLDQDL